METLAAVPAAARRRDRTPPGLRRRGQRRRGRASGLPRLSGVARGVPGARASTGVSSTGASALFSACFHLRKCLLGRFCPPARRLLIQIEKTHIGNFSRVFQPIDREKTHFLEGVVTRPLYILWFVVESASTGLLKLNSDAVSENLLAVCFWHL